MLAGTIQSPSRWDPAKNLDKSTERWNFVLDGMVAQGWLPAADRAQAAVPDVPARAAAGRRHPRRRGRARLQAGAGRARVARDLRAGDQHRGPHDRPDDRLEAPGAGRRRGDEGAQGPAGQPAQRAGLRRPEDRRDRGLLRRRRTAWATTTPRRCASPGSSFKPFVLSAALQDSRQNVGLGSLYDGSSPQNFLGIQVANSEGFSCNPCDVQTAMTKSVNTVFYKMGIDTGPAEGGRRRAPGRHPGRRAAQPHGRHRAGRQGGPADRHGVGVRDLRRRRDPPRRPTWSRRSPPPTAACSTTTARRPASRRCRSRWPATSPSR